MRTYNSRHCFRQSLPPYAKMQQRDVTLRHTALAAVTSARDAARVVVVTKRRRQLAQLHASLVKSTTLGTLYRRRLATLVVDRLTVATLQTHTISRHTHTHIMAVAAGLHQHRTTCTCVISNCCCHRLSRRVQCKQCRHGKAFIEQHRKLTHTNTRFLLTL